jgi:hypothetical protein
MVRDLAERPGFRQRITPHTFRHSAATWMLRSGMNPLPVAQVLGHSSLDMIQLNGRIEITRLQPPKGRDKEFIGDRGGRRAAYRGAVAVAASASVVLAESGRADVPLSSWLDLV